MARHETGVRRVHMTVRNFPKEPNYTSKTKMQMKITTTPDVIWEKCALDIVGPLIQQTPCSCVLSTTAIA